MLDVCVCLVFFFKQKTAYWFRISDWSSDVCSSDLRALLNAALDGSLNNAEFRMDENFGFEVPVSVPGVDSKILDPRQTWANGAEYDAAALKLIGLFADNFEQFAEHVDEAVRKIALRAPEPA